MRFPPPDHTLLDFDTAELVSYRPERTDELLGSYPEGFRAQLVVAKHLDNWADRVEERAGPAANRAFQVGFISGLREVAAHLREGDLLPGGVFYEEMFGTPPRPSE
jgi:hypothetical protein